MIDMSMLDDFIAETAEHIEEMEASLLRLEAAPDNQEILNDLFRDVHTIKGSSEYLGIERIAELTHRLEDLLDQVRRGKRAAGGELVDLLIASRDRIATLLVDLQGEHAEKTEVADLIEQIDRMASSDEGIEPAAAETPPAPVEPESPSAEPFSQAQATTPAPTPEPVPTSPTEQEEVYEEELDEELFEIFTQQLDETLAEIRGHAEELKTAANPTAGVRQLKSSANYMGYDRLKAVYQKWLEEIEELQVAASLGDNDAFTDFADRRLPEVEARIRSFFPSADAAAPREIETKETVDLPAVPAPPAETAPQEDDTHDALYRRLSQAFDRSVGDQVDDAGQPVHEQLFASRDTEAEALSETPASIADQPTQVDTLSEWAEKSTQQSPPREPTDMSGHPEAEAGAEDRAASMPEEPLAGDAESAPTATPESPEPPDQDHRRSSPGRRITDVLGEDVADRRSQIHPGRRQSDRAPARLTKQSVRVDSRKIDDLMNQVGELVVSRAWFSQLFHEMRSLETDLRQTAKLDQREMKRVRGLTFRISEATVALGRVANELQEGVMKVRMLPISQLFNRYPRLVRDLVHASDKQVSLNIRGEDTELDKMIIEEISDPLVHIIRNAVDHGIENVAERRRRNKPEIGQLRLEAYHESNHVVIEVEDDGCGLNEGRIRQRALDAGMATAEELETMNRRDLIAFILRPGFSTAEAVTHTSGRGVGMDVVKQNVEKLNGTLEIDSKPDSGTLVRIKIPLTLAIIPALLVRVHNELFTVPLATVEKTLRVFQTDTSTIEGMEVIHLRQSTLPLVRLAEIFGLPQKPDDAGKEFVVIVSTGLQRIGLVVDELIGQEEVVIKPLADYLQEQSGFSGATILGDGRISLILDIYQLVNLTIGHESRRKQRHLHAV